MASSPLLSRWISEFCAPVVVTLATAEAEKICLQNGLLLHELLSCFGHLDDISVNIRVGKQAFNLHEAHLRFERATEIKVKTSDVIENLLLQNFTPYDIDRLSHTVPELKNSPPTAWTNKAEQLVARSLSFSEFEMISQPVVILTVVATDDIDPVAAMQELTSIHHTPACFSNGQYDPSIVRVFMLLEDGSSRSKDALTVLRSLQGYFPPQNTKLLTINSLPVSNPNLHQPDMWSRYLIPKFFPQHAPSIDLTKVLPISPANQQPVIGCRLSGDDFMKLRGFCVWIYTELVAPLLERRIAILSNQVNETRKGMKNLFKSFLRKPRDESDNSRGGIKYRFDRIESQIMLLGDISFMIKDYETALSMYRMVKDDFRADKANLHYAQVLLMISICQIISEPHKYKEVYQQVDAIGQCISAGLEMPHASAYLAMLGSEIYTWHNNIRAPLESARLLLVASSTLAPRHPVLGSLLMERAALFYLQAGQTRKFILHEVILANRLLRNSPVAARHSTACFAAALMLLENSDWSDMNARLAKALARDLKSKPGVTQEDAHRSLLFLLKMLQTTLADSSCSAQEESSLQDAVQVLQEIQGSSGGGGNDWGNVRLRNWEGLATRDILLSPLTFEPLEAGQNGVEIWGLPIPELNVQSVRLLQSVNGLVTFDSDLMFTSEVKAMRSRLFSLFEVEKRWIAAQSAPLQPDQAPLVLEDMWMKALQNEDKEKDSSDNNNGGNMMHRVPLGEKLLVKATFKNKLPIDITLNNAKAIVQPQDAFTMHESSEIILAGCTKDLFLALVPKTVGTFEVNSVGWNLGKNLMVRQSVQKKGPLLHRTMDQRFNRLRGTDTSLQFEVVSAQPWLELDFEGLSEEVLQGQLLKTLLVIKNRGAAVAGDIYIKLSDPLFVFCMQDVMTKTRKVLDFVGKSYTLLHLKDITIAPGKEVQLEAWMKIPRPGQQTIHVLAVYSTYAEDGTAVVGGPSRTSFLSVRTCGLPSIGISARWAGRSTSAGRGTLITEVTNHMLAVNETDMMENVRKSSVGQLDMMLGEQFSEVDLHCFKLVSMLMIGAAKSSPSASSSSLSSSPSMVNIGAHISPTERYAQCFLVRATNAGSGSVSWLLPPASALQEVMEQFLCLHYETAAFGRQLSAARQRLMEEELQLVEGRPRTIAEVRRDRQRQQLEAGGQDGDEAALTNVTLDNEKIEPYSPSGLRDGLQAIIKAEHSANTLGLAMLWVCRWQDRIRWGMHQVPFIRPGGTRKGGSSSDDNKRLSESVVVAVHHGAGASVLTAPEPGKSLPLQVVVELRSLINQPLLISLKAVGGMDEASSSLSPSSAAVASPSLTESASAGQVSEVRTLWQGKSRYDDQELPPRGSITLSFTLLVLQPGVINTNKFSFRAKFAETGEELGGGSRDTHGFLIVPGESIVHIVRPAS